MRDRAALQAHAVGSILLERDRQDTLKADGRFAKTCADPMLDSERLAILVEEVGEVARVVVERAGLAHDMHGKALHKELIQVAAVCVAWLEGLGEAAV